MAQLACSGDGASAPSSPTQGNHFRFGPFSGFDSLRHYEYSYSEFNLNQVPVPHPDTAKIITTVVGFTVDVNGHGNDTIRLKVGKQSSIATRDSATDAWDKTYDTSYSFVSYFLDGNTYKVVNDTIPFPFLDMAFVTDIDTLPAPPESENAVRIRNLEDARNGAPAEYLHSFASGYSGGGSGNGEIGIYRAGVGLIEYSVGSAWHNVTIKLVSAN